jgi:hypothetical protein
MKRISNGDTTGKFGLSVSLHVLLMIAIAFHIGIFRLKE